MIYFQVKINKSGKIIAGNMQNFSKFDDFSIKNKNFLNCKNGRGIKSVEENIGNISIWIVIEDESDLLKSSKLFKKTVSIYKQVAIDFWENYRKQIELYAHTISTIQLQIRNKIEGFAEDEKFYGENYNDSIRKISECINNDTKSAADLICYTHKRIRDLRAHLSGTEIVYSEGFLKVDLSSVNLKKAILNQYTPFVQQLEENSVKLRIYFEDDCEVEVDKDMFSLVFYNFFSNAAKYTKPYSEIRMNYAKDQKILDISMMSLKMERDEIKNLFNEGSRGKYAADINGKGIGLFIIKRALELMNKEKMLIEPCYAKSANEGGKIYIENHFKFFF